MTTQRQSVKEQVLAELKEREAAWVKYNGGKDLDWSQKKALKCVRRKHDVADVTSYIGRSRGAVNKALDALVKDGELFQDQSGHRRCKAYFVPNAQERAGAQQRKDERAARQEKEDMLNAYGLNANIMHSKYIEGRVTVDSDALCQLIKDLTSDEPREAMSQEEVDAQLTAVANEAMGIDTLEERKMDSFDFHELSVWEIKKALQLAYALGQRSAQ